MSPMPSLYECEDSKCLDNVTIPFYSDCAGEEADMNLCLGGSPCWKGVDVLVSKAGFGHMVMAVFG